jgi:putative Mn2+ efflux pump MntP
VFINTILLGAAGLLALVGLWMIASHFAKAPGRYDRPSRMDNLQVPSGLQMNRLHLAMTVICVAIGLLLVWVYRVNGSN